MKQRTRMRGNRKAYSFMAKIVSVIILLIVFIAAALIVFPSRVQNMASDFSDKQLAKIAGKNNASNLPDATHFNQVEDSKKKANLFFSSIDTASGKECKVKLDPNFEQGAKHITLQFIYDTTAGLIGNFVSPEDGINEKYSFKNYTKIIILEDEADLLDEGAFTLKSTITRIAQDMSRRKLFTAQYETKGSTEVLLESENSILINAGKSSSFDDGITDLWEENLVLTYAIVSRDQQTIIFTTQGVDFASIPDCN